MIVDDKEQDRIEILINRLEGTLDIKTSFSEPLSKRLNLCIIKVQTGKRILKEALESLGK
jgi:hypothetical protein